MRQALAAAGRAGDDRDHREPRRPLCPRTCCRRRTTGAGGHQNLWDFCPPASQACTPRRRQTRRRAAIGLWVLAETGPRRPSRLHDAGRPRAATVRKTNDVMLAAQDSTRRRASFAGTSPQPVPGDDARTPRAMVDDHIQGIGCWRLARRSWSPSWRHCPRAPPPSLCLIPRRQEAARELPAHVPVATSPSPATARRATAGVTERRAGNRAHCGRRTHWLARVDPGVRPRRGPVPHATPVPTSTSSPVTCRRSADRMARYSGHPVTVHPAPLNQHAPCRRCTRKFGDGTRGTLGSARPARQG